MPNMHGVCMPNMHGAEVKAKVKFDNRQTDRQINKNSNSDHSIWVI